MVTAATAGRSEAQQQEAAQHRRRKPPCELRPSGPSGYLLAVKLRVTAARQCRPEFADQLSHVPRGQQLGLR